MESQEVLATLQVDPNFGLNPESVQQRLEKFGPNRFETYQAPSAYRIFIRQFKSLLVGLLFLASIVSLVTGEWLEAAAILGVLFLNGFLGFISEFRALRSMEALRKLGQVQARIVRDKEEQQIAAEDLVPGDIVLLEAGDVVSSDARIFKSNNLSVDESMLTGESVPVDKIAEVLGGKNLSISERSNMIWKGTHITRGTGRAVVVKTGTQTELGRIAELTSEAKEETTPLEKRLDQLGKKLMFITLVIAVSIAISGILGGKELGLMLQTAIALAVATVPEGLPIVTTIALARGLWIMAKKNALIKRLSAVETLGATSVIITDKTGTLTENKMAVANVRTRGRDHRMPIESNSESGESLEEIIRVVDLCNNAKEAGATETFGDPMEVALHTFAAEFFSATESPQNDLPRVKEIPFDSKSKMMATVHQRSNDFYYAVKGAPESVIASSNVSESEKTFWRRENEHLAFEGLRLLGVASKTASSPKENPYASLKFLGLVGLIDPARPDVACAIEKCKAAGIQVIMATGDQHGTATKIAHDVGLSEIFSRVSPEDKFDLVKSYQEKGHIVAMTGDGVNDAPALKKADIGIAMGMRGTQVAQEASDMVLRDDRFETIVSAIHHGRVIYSNIQRFVVYLLSCNISEVFVIGIAIIFSDQLPITPLQILFLNLVTDVFPAMALGLGTGDASYLKQRPRPNTESILERTHWQFIFFYGGIITISVLAIFYLSLSRFQVSPEKANTLAFLTLGISQLFLVFNLRKRGSSVYRNDVTQNPFVWIALALCLMIFGLSVQWSWLQETLGMTALTGLEWAAVLLFSLLPLVGQRLIMLD